MNILSDQLGSSHDAVLASPVNERRRSSSRDEERLTLSPNTFSLSPSPLRSLSSDRYHLANSSGQSGLEKKKIGGKSKNGQRSKSTGANRLSSPTKRSANRVREAAFSSSHTTLNPAISPPSIDLVPGSWHAGGEATNEVGQSKSPPYSRNRRTAQRHQSSDGALLSPSAAAAPSSSSRSRYPAQRTKSSPTSNRKTPSHQPQQRLGPNLPNLLPLIASPTESNHSQSSSRHSHNPPSKSSSTVTMLQRLTSHSNSSSRHSKSPGNFNGHLSSSSFASFGGLGHGSSGSMIMGASISSSATNAATTTSAVIPPLYRCARKGYWDDFGASLKDASLEDLSFRYKKDGTTALHLAIMSRTGYIDSFKTGGSGSSGDRKSKSADHSSSTLQTEHITPATTTTAEATVPSTPSKDTVVANIAPLSVIEDLLRRAPDLANIKCTLNGYTPLTYACLVCNEHYDTEDGAAMVRLFLQYCPSSLYVFSREGLSPVDIHVVSYSHHHKNKEDGTARGKTSTAVLRTLLQHAPDLANLRLSGDKVQGPIELLYKCNSSTFSRAVMDEVYNSDDDGTVRSDYTIPERRQQVVDTVTKWWIWTWAVMILKYGSLVANKKKGSRFAAVHTAAMQVGVPTPILSITLYAFPRQIKQIIEDKDGVGNLPLHAVCSWPCQPVNHPTGLGDPIVSIRKTIAINRVLDEYPIAVKVNNKRGESPLELALKSGTTWDGGVRRIVKAHPKALKLQSPTTRLYPFMTAAAAFENVEEVNPDDTVALASLQTSSTSGKQDLQCLRTIYGLLRSNPKVFVQACQKGQENKGVESNKRTQTERSDEATTICEK